MYTCICILYTSMLTRSQEAPITQKALSGCLGGVQEGLWGGFGRLEWSLGPTREAVDISLFCMFVCEMRFLLTLFCDFFL